MLKHNIQERGILSFVNFEDLEEYLRDMNDLIDRWYSLRLIQDLKDD